MNKNFPIDVMNEEMDMERIKVFGKWIKVLILAPLAVCLSVMLYGCAEYAWYESCNGLSRAVIYSIVETAKANNLNPYYYFEHLLTEIPKLKEFNTPEEEVSAMERLLPWSADLPEKCHKRSR